MKKKVVVIGGGPGGYVAAIRAAQLGAEVHLIEKEKIGGTCLNVGCIPTKALLHTAKLYEAVINGSNVGIKAENVRVDWPALLQRKKNIVDKLVGGVVGLLKTNNIKIHNGRAVLKNANTIEIDKQHQLTADIIVIASGSKPANIKFPGVDLPGVINSTEALSLSDIPSSMLIVGAGVIGVEFACLFNSLGCKVTIVELLEDILPMVDKEIALAVKRDLEAKGITFLNEAKLTQIKKDKEGLIAEIDIARVQKDIVASHVLVAVGRCPNISEMGLEETGVKIEKGRVSVNKYFATDVPNIYAIGDCNGIAMLAHAASAQGIYAVEHALGYKQAHYSGIIPSCIYTSPEVAGIGYTEQQLIELNRPYKVGRFSLAGNGKSIIENEGKGMVKLLAGDKYGEILGIHIYGPRATELIAGAGLALRLEATIEEIYTTIHAHPTVGEAICEAALDVKDIAIHWPPR